MNLIRMSYSDYLQTDHWHAVRNAALERAGHACQVCNSKERLDVHHRTYQRIGHEQDADVVVLCHACHSRFHDKQPTPAPFFMDFSRPFQTQSDGPVSAPGNLETTIKRNTAVIQAKMDRIKHMLSEYRAANDSGEWSAAIQRKERELALLEKMQANQLALKARAATQEQ